ncbi:ABC transporter ATP-binding protein [Desulfotruncus alcoholivorax]|uniref:ABC transporter ATP-binding protein n=1 Tax=Desulfotruncus alcoholivorax TaxID=265477 RepID=UPI00040499CD|nr:ABC transporter ATP-binding protein [Desulfotruncus alcoholivorax]
MEQQPLLKVTNLKTHFFTDDGVVPAVDGVSFTVNVGETLAIVGESGSGKSVTSTSILRLVPSPPGRIIDGSIIFEDTDLLGKTEDEMQRIRGDRISMIFQEPMTSLNPVHRVGEQIAEAYRLHRGMDKHEAMQRAVRMLERVGIPSPEKRAGDFPHQLSGGMRQRVMIAIALSCRPALLIADEPTTALDVTIQAQILDLMRKLQEESRTSILLITHDLGVVAEMADRVIVMYAGKVVEEGDVAAIFKNPLHPYTRGLLGSIPRLDWRRRTILPSIEGVVPNPLEFPTGCRFNPRCPDAGAKCRESEPALKEMTGSQKVACWLMERGC